MLERLQKFVDEMKSTSSLNEKKVIIDSIKNDSFITLSLNYTYDPYKKYYVTSKTCKKNTGLFKYNLYNHLFDLLDDLENRVITGHDSIAAVNGFVTANPGYEDLIFSIIDRNLEIRASDSVINKVIPNLNLLNIPICCILNICGKMLFSAKTFLHKHIIPAEKSVVYMNMFEFNTQWTHHNIYLHYTEMSFFQVE